MLFSVDAAKEEDTSKHIKYTLSQKEDALFFTPDTDDKTKN